MAAERVLEELRRVAFSDIRTFFDAKGNLKPVQALTPEEGSLLSAIDVVNRHPTGGDGGLDTIRKIRLWDKIRALEILAKHFQLLSDKPADAPPRRLVVHWEG